MGRLDGRVAIVTGAASGLGEAQAKLFIQEGARVVLADIDSKGQKLADELGSNATFLLHDVASEQSWVKVAAHAEREFGLPTVLVNTAGVSLARTIAETTVADFERLFRVNQLGVFLGIRQMIDPMTRAGGGAIINISSAAGMRGYLNLGAYAATKWAVRGISRVAAMELAPLKIRVNTILPGAFLTPLSMTMLDTFETQVKPKLPIRRMGDPKELAEATVFLASDAASYVVGADLTVDGGDVL